MVEGPLDVELAPNDVILLRWRFKVNSEDYNYGLAIDDLKVEALE